MRYHVMNSVGSSDSSLHRSSSIKPLDVEAASPCALQALGSEHVCTRAFAGYECSTDRRVDYTTQWHSLRH